MPQGTVNPFNMRFDTGGVPVGYLVLSSETKSIAEIQDKALFRVRPMFAAIEGVSAPPPYAYARLSIQLSATWAVPAVAVGKLNDEPVIYLVENGKIVRASVQLLRGDGQFTQIRGYRKPGTSDWVNVTGTESIATPASAATDGQTVNP